MDLGLQGRRAIITGASQGIGKAIAYELAAEGVHLALCARNGPALAATADEVRQKFGVQVWAQPTDVTDNAAVRAFIEGAAQALRGLDILVNNAGRAQPGGFEEVTEAQWRADLDVKLFAAMECARVALPYLKQSDQARIVNINSIVGKQSTPGYIANTTDRAACLAFSKVLADNLARYHILVNSVSPGNIRSEAWGSSVDYFAPGQALDDYYSEIGRATPLGRVGDGQEVAAVVAFLASRRASYLTGANIDVDGGLARYIF